MANRPSDFVTEVRQVSTALLQTVNGLDALRREWDGLDYLNTITGEGGFEGSNSDVDVDDIAAVIGTTLDAINELLNSGHRTNLLGIRT
jgi:plastocyanin domain-containing protein